MQLKSIIQVIEELAPLNLAESWDNVGLLVGSREKEISSAVLCLDITTKAYDLCIENNAGLCICHHPFIFDSIKRMDYADPYFDLLQKFIKADIAIYAAHTNLDSCIGGVNDSLADVLSLKVIQTFMPSNSLFDFSKNIVAGVGRICTPKNEINLFDFYKQTISNLKTTGGHINFDSNRLVHRVLVVGGAYDSQWNKDVLDNDIDVVVSGEIKQRDMVYFDRYNVATISAGHDATERVILSVFADYLQLKLAEIRFAVSLALDYNKVVSE